MQKCSSCERETYPEDAFCSQCGTRLQPRNADTGLVRRTILKQTTATIDRLACGSCNGPLLAGEVFCATCGARYGPATSQPGHREVRAEILRKLEVAAHGKFEFVREIGRGGMGAVYLARELELERNVAIKVLSSSWLTDDSMVERFRREARTIASLRHPSIVHVHGVGRAEDIHYFVMDFIDGVSLGRILLTHGPLSIPATLAILGQVGSALNYAHRPGRSVIHRDIKPGNIMVDREGGSYVTDFGISKATGSPSGLTMTGLIMGTPEYMSPEQCRGDTAGPAADQYALGAVAFAMLTGSPPFTGPHYRVLVGHTAEQPPLIRDLRPDCPAEIADAVARMLAKAPGDRWPDIAQAMSALGARPTLPDDPVRDELAGLVAAARGSRRQNTGPTPEVAPPESSATPTWLRILSLPASIEAGDAIALRARKGFADGREVENGDITWETTDPAIARIDPDTGRLVAIGAGSAVITASVAEVRESVPIVVQPARVAQLIVEPADMELEVGETRAFAAEPRNRGGHPLERRVLWSSSDPGVATISDRGAASAHREGSASVLAHCEGVGASAAVTVMKARVAALEFIDPPTSMHVGTSARLAVQASDARGARLDPAVMFSTSNDAIARVSADGVIDAVGQGSSSITAECDGRSATFEISVAPQPAAAVRTSSPPSELIAGDTFHLVATPLDGDGQPLDLAIDWSVADERVIKPLGGGRFRALADGHTIVCARSGAAESKVELSVDPVRITALVLSAPPETMHVDEVADLTVQMFDQRGRPVEKPVSWSTSDPWIARVTARGVLEGAGPGSATIIAECDGVSDSAVVEVTASPWGTVVFKPEPPADTGNTTGDTAADVVPAEPAGDNVMAGTGIRRLIWLAPVAIVGVAGAAWLAFSGGDDALPPVSAEPVASAILVAANGNAVSDALNLTVGDTVRLLARVAADDGSALPDVIVEWSSADPSLASIDASGTLLALAAGAVRVVAGTGDVTRGIDLNIAAAAPEPPVTAARPQETRPRPTQDPPQQTQQTRPVTDPRPPENPPPAAPQPDGVLQLIVLPWADIWVDGEQRGSQGRQIQLNLAPGRHTLRLVNPNMVTVDTTFEIVSGQPRSLRITLTPREP
jgi:serine/threonine-protein kinase